MNRGFSSLYGWVSPCGGFFCCQGFPGDAVVRNPPANAGDSIPGLCYSGASHNETESVPCGAFQAVPVGSKLFLCSIFLFVGNRRILDLPRVPKGRFFNSGLSVKGENAYTREKQ